MRLKSSNVTPAGVVKVVVKPAVMFFSSAIGATLVISEVAALFAVSEMPGATPATPVLQPIPQLVFPQNPGSGGFIRPGGSRFELMPGKVYEITGDTGRLRGQ